MKRMKNTALLSLLILLSLAMLVLAGCDQVTEVPTDDTYSFTNPEVLKAQPDAGIVIDGVLDEQVYQNNNWLYLHNDDGGNNVNIAMTSYYGENGMYIVYDVTESVPIYVNPDRSPVLNSCIEMYLAPPDLATVQDNSVFEIDLMPTGDMSFRKSNGAYGYTNVITTNENMAVLGATTKGGEVNTPECYGYCLELFIPWDYMTWLDMDTDAMRDGFVYINPAHITSNNYEGTNTNLDRYWYYYAQQQGADFSNVFQYFRFNGDGVIGAVPVTAKAGENCTITGQNTIMPGMLSNLTIAPEDGYALTSILVNGEEQIQNVSFNEDGSVTLKARATNEGLTVSASAEPVTQGNKTLSGKISIHSMAGGDLTDVLAYYVGPTGEKPLEFDSQGNFEHKDLAQGYYTIKVEKEGYTSITRGICLNRDIYTELTLEYEMFQATYGTSWILDQQNDGVLQKFGGSGQIMSQQSYNNFTFCANLKYDEELAKQGDNDNFTQQRCGMRILFSNGKYWHINVLKEKDQYILQYGKQTGDASLFNWKTVRVMSDSEVAKYKSEDGISLKIMRQGRHAAVWLDGKLLVIELLGEEYLSCTAQLGMEAWVANRSIMEIPYSISPSVPVNVAGSPFHWPAEIWDISNQYNGTVSKYPAPGKDTWLDAKINVTDVTTVARDLSPNTNDYCLIYIFKFSNGENFRVRLNHTDDDGAYRIQSFAGSTLFEPWKNHYTLTAEQAAKVKGNGVSFRVQILGTTAYVLIDGEPACTYDLSTVVATGKPSGIEKATCTVSFRMDGNNNGVTVLPFQLSYNPSAQPPDMSQTAQAMAQKERNDFTYETYVKFDPVLAEQGTDDHYTQQRSGMRIAFSNGKVWHIHLLKEKDACYVQYAAMSGDSSLYNWTNIRRLTDEEIAAYTSEGGISLKVMRQGNFAAVWLGGTLLRVEKLSDEYIDLTAKLSLECWISGKTSSDMVGNIADSVAVDLAASAFYWPTETWDISGQYDGYISKDGVAGNVTWADSVITANDVTTVVRDMFPDSRDYAMVHIFKFSNGQSFRIRLHHTDNDGAYRIQTFSGSTLTQAWKIHYKLTPEQEDMVKGDGLAFRTQVIGTTAYVYLEDEMVCTCDLSKVIATGQPSGIETATATISLRMDGNIGQITQIPVQISYDPDAQPPEPEETEPEETEPEETEPEVTEPTDPEDESYSDFTYEMKLRFDTQLEQQGTTDYYTQQRAGMKITFSNGKVWQIHLMKENGKYIVQYAKMKGDASLFGWSTLHTLTQDEIAAYQSEEGITLKVQRQGNFAAVWLNGTLYKIEKLDSSFENLTAQMCAEAWIADVTADQIEATVTGSVPVDLSSAAFYWPTLNWDISGQFEGTFSKYSVAGDTTWLDSVINVNDVTTTVHNMFPDSRDFAMVYIFKFSNGQTFRLRLHNTDTDGAYRIQSFHNSSLTPVWKNYYKLTDQQVAKVIGDGLDFRVQISGTTAYVSLDGEQVCTCDLSTVIATGQPSGVENATATISFRMDGNVGQTTVIPFQLAYHTQRASRKAAEEDVTCQELIALPVNTDESSSVKPTQEEAEPDGDAADDIAQDGAQEAANAAPCEAAQELSEPAQ